MTIERVRTDSPWEEAIGFARAVAAGDRVLVAGTLPLAGGVLQGEGDPYEQTKAAFGNALAALEPFGLDASAVLRTRMYLTHARDVDAVGRAHREIFGAAPPAATLVVVSGFVDSRVLVEVELEAFKQPEGFTQPEASKQPEGFTHPSEGA
ncbi:RidA family protein [Streptomyces sp. BBFR2]|uniref:RidA family protein n=1 Tax=Streptomyces sp. BBFR2 TaxID=3372854 RepID=UPI0037D9A42E